MVGSLCLMLTRCVELADLRRKFEDDKKKIADMKANRKFKPY
jgi:hypothetical protein